MPVRSQELTCESESSSELLQSLWNSCNCDCLRILQLLQLLTPGSTRPSFRSNFCISFRYRTGMGRYDLLLELLCARRV